VTVAVALAARFESRALSGFAPWVTPVPVIEVIVSAVPGRALVSRS